MRSARTARVLTRSTLRGWSLMPLAEDAEIIVGELAANAVIHAAGCGRPGEYSELRLLRRTSQLICAVLDPADGAPVLKTPAEAGEAGRGLRLVDAVSDVRGWSPVPGRGKVVWATLFCG
jgi:anti-sigma regulatory factor (Ser/Thr protein kinase)